MAPLWAILLTKILLLFLYGNPPFSKSLSQCTSLTVFSSSCVTTCLSSSLPSSLLCLVYYRSCTDVPGRFISPYWAPVTWKRIPRLSDLGHFSLTSLSVCLGTHRSEIIFAMILTPQFPHGSSAPFWNFLTSFYELPTKLHNRSTCFWICNPFFCSFPPQSCLLYLS